MIKALCCLSLFLLGCGGSSAPCGNGNVYCSPTEVCVSGDCLPRCIAYPDMGTWDFDAGVCQ